MKRPTGCGTKGRGGGASRGQGRRGRGLCGTRVERYRPWLYRVAAQALEDPEAALDCVQETLYRGCESLPRFRQR